MDRQFPIFGVLNGHLADGDLRRLELLLRVVCSPPSADGLLIAIRSIRASLDAVRSFTSLQRLDRLYAWVDGLDRQLAAIPDLPVHLRAKPDLKPLSQQYRMLFERANAGYRDDVAIRIKAVQGLAIAHGLGATLEIQENFARHWLTLVRASNSNRKEAVYWRDLAHALPLTIDAIDAYDAGKAPQSVLDFLHELKRLIDGRVPDLPDVSETTSAKANSIDATPTDARTPDDDRSKSDDIGEPHESQHDGDTDQDDLPEQLAHKEGFVRWQSERGQTCHRLAACGLQHGWQFLHRTELRRRTRLLAKQLQTEDELQRKLAALALVSLLVGLPPKLVLALSLVENGDLWVDLDMGAACWSLAQIVDRNPPESWIVEAGYRPTEIVRLPMAVVLHEALLALRLSNPSASRLGELLFPNATSCDEMLTRYEKFLRADDRTSHGTFPSRFAYSLGRLVLHITGQDTIAALASLDFALVGASQLDYLCVHEDILLRAIEQGNEFLELGPTVQLRDRRWLGSPFRPRSEVITSSWTRMVEESERLKRAASSRCGLSDFLAAFNRLAELNLVATTFLMAHRGTRLPRLNFTALYHCSLMVLASDKEISSFAAYRPVPRHPLLASILDGHLENIKALVHRLDSHDRKLAKQLRRLCEGLRPFCPVFFTIQMKGDRLRPRTLRTADLSQTTRDVFTAAKNFGRHFWLSRFVELGVLRNLPRVLLGHSRKDMTPHGVAMAVAPRVACDLVSVSINQIVDDLALKPLAALRQISPSRPALTLPTLRRIGFLGNAIVDEFLKSQRLYRYKERIIAESPPVDRFSMLGFGFIESLRRRLADGVGLPDEWACFLMSLVMYGGQFSPLGLRAIWMAIGEKRLHRLGNVPVVEADFPEACVPLPLPAPVTLFLNKALYTVQPTFGIALSNLAKWLVSAFPGCYWPSEPKDGLSMLGALTQRWLRLELSPHVFTCSDPAFGAAAVSLSSIARTSFNRPRIWTDEDWARQSNRGKRIGTLAEEIGGLYDLVALASDTNQRKGENQRRRSLIRENLLNYLQEHGSQSALSESIWNWLFWEVTHCGDSARILDVASLASYLSKLQDALLKLDADTGIDELEPEEWMNFLADVEHDFTGDNLQQRRSIARRFARYWRLSGAAVPQSIFADPDQEHVDGQYVVRSSSVHISQSEGNVIGSILQNRFEAGSILQQKALAKLAMTEGGPFRTSEASRIGRKDIDEEFSAVLVRTSGFSHLKNKASRRSITLPEAAHKRVVALRDRVTAIVGHDEFIFLLDGDEERHRDVVAIDCALSESLVLATGEPNARKHCLRGSAANRSIFAEFEELLAALGDGRSFPCREIDATDETWLRTATTAGQCGHSGVLSTLLYYFAGWPWALYFQMTASLDRCSPGDHLSAYADGWKPAALRKALSRFRADEKNSSTCGWEIFKGQLEAIDSLPSVELLLSPAPIIVPPLEDRDAGQVAGLATKQAHYLALRMAGLNPSLSLDESRIPQAFVGPLEKSLNSYMPDGAKTLQLEPHQMSPLRNALASGRGLEMLAMMSRWSNASELATVVAATSPTGWSPKPNEVHAVPAVAATIVKLLPKTLTATVLPSRAEGNNTLSFVLARIDSDIVVKPSSKRLLRGYRIGVTCRDKAQRGPRPDGEFSRLFHLLCHARMATLLFLN